MTHILKSSTRTRRRQICRKHAFARISENVGAGSPSRRTSASATPVNYAVTPKRAMRCGINRYYDPATGQFISVDPLVGASGQPYAYTGDNPINRADPEGLRWFWMTGQNGNRGWHWWTGHEYDYLCPGDETSSHCGGPTSPPSSYAAKAYEADVFGIAQVSERLNSIVMPIRRFYNSPAVHWVGFVGKIGWWCYGGNRKTGAALWGAAEGSAIPLVGTAGGAIIGGLGGCVYGYEMRLTAANQTPLEVP